MTDSEAEKLEYQSSQNEERSDMSASAQAILRDYAGARWPALNHKGRMARLAGALGLGHRRVRSLYQNEAGVAVRADEMAAIAALRKAKADDALRASQQEYRALEARIAALEELFRAGDEDHHRPFMDAFRNAARGQGGGFGGGGAGNGPARDGED